MYFVDDSFVYILQFIKMLSVVTETYQKYPKDNATMNLGFVLFCCKIVNKNLTRCYLK